MPLHYTNELGEYGIPERFRHALKETSTIESAERTEKNIREADGILTLLYEPEVAQEGGRESLEKVSPGTMHGLKYAKELDKRDEQLYFVNLANTTTTDETSQKEEQHKVVKWLRENKIMKCAIGGPRESEVKGIEEKSFIFLKGVFEEYKQS